VGGGVQLGPLGTAATNRPILPAPGDDGEIDGMIGRGNRSTLRKPAPVPLCPTQTPHAARTRTRAAAVGSQRLTVWATARPLIHLVQSIIKHTFYFKMSLITKFKIHEISLKSYFSFEYCNMFRPYETIIRQLLLDRNQGTAWAPCQYIYMLYLHVVIIRECTPALHSRYFLVAASILCSILY
jgi:hypothetical protein